MSRVEEEQETNSIIVKYQRVLSQSIIEIFKKYLYLRFEKFFIQHYFSSIFKTRSLKDSSFHRGGDTIPCSCHSLASASHLQGCTKFEINRTGL